jgi:predicted DCC family thiol-disulfide oxidoreductase YuxK
MQSPQDKPILLFDGVCNLCNGFVNFAIAHDPHAKLLFAALQSETGQRLIQKYAIPNDLRSFIFVEQNHYDEKSTAILKVLKRLHGAWPLLFGLMIVPTPIRNAVYDFIAKNRYRWFGKETHCRIPTEETKRRFLA